MAYKGQTYQILGSEIGFQHSFNLDSMPPTAAVMPSTNINLHRGGVSKRGGTEHINTTALSGTPKITGIHDFWMRGGTHYIVFTTSDGKVWKNTTDTIKTGWTTDKYTSAIVADDKLYICNGGAAPATWDGTTWTTMTNVHTDWATVGYPQQFILHGLGNQQRLWAVGFTNGGVYYSENGALDDFTTTGIYINTGDGFGTVGAVEFGDRLIVFGKTQSFIIDDTDGTPSNWGYQAAQWYGGVAHWRLLIRTPNDIIAMMEDGEIYSVIVAENYGDYKAASITRPSWIHNYIEEYIDLTKINLFHGLYDPVLRAVRIWMVRKGESDPDQCLMYFIDRTPDKAWVIHDNLNYDSGYKAHASGVVRTAQGAYTIYTGDEEGFLWKLEQADQSDNGEAYYAGIRTANITMDNPRVTKMLNRLRVVTQPEGNYNLSYSIFVDGSLHSSGTILLTGVGGTLGSFILGTDVLGGMSLIDTGVIVGAIGKRFQIELYNSNANQDFFISQVLLDFKPMGAKNE